MKPPVLLSSYDPRLQAAASTRNFQLRQERRSPFLHGPIGPFQGNHRVGMVIIDMQSRSMGYRHGSFEDGIRRLELLLDVAKKFGIPCIVVEAEGDGRQTIREILERLPPGTKTIIKPGDSAFSADRFQPCLMELGINILVLCGYSPEICVPATARDALVRGYSLLTSDELLFGGNSLLRRFYMPFYKRKTEYYDTTTGVLAALGRYILQEASNTRSGGAPRNSSVC